MKCEPFLRYEKQRLHDQNQSRQIVNEWKRSSKNSMEFSINSFELKLFKMWYTTNRSEFKHLKMSALCLYINSQSHTLSRQNNIYTIRILEFSMLNVAAIQHIDN